VIIEVEASSSEWILSIHKNLMEVYKHLYLQLGLMEGEIQGTLFLEEDEIPKSVKEMFNFSKSLSVEFYQEGFRFGTEDRYVEAEDVESFLEHPEHLTPAIDCLKPLLEITKANKVLKEAEKSLLTIQREIEGND
jgi:ADP-dependent phosphofructokinase/glucokinase